jgi:UDP-2,4-diacetamido-2,4,6-trideoxy-beta-L-altropyranose hydrolase
LPPSPPLPHRVLIRADGSHRIGLGHIYRMRTLALALRGRGHRVLWVTLENPASTALLRAAGLEYIPYAEGTLESTLIPAVRELNPDLVLNDTLATTPEALAQIRALTDAPLLTFDDTGAGLQLADAVINAFAFHWGRYDPRACRARLYEGPAYMILQEGVIALAQKDKAIAAQANHLCLSFGGTDTHFITERALEAVNQVWRYRAGEIRGPLEVTVNLGPGSAGSPRLDQAVAASPHRVRLRRAAPDLLDELQRTDLVLCAGGNMLYELAAMGVPAIAIPAEPHEVSNVHYWGGVGTAVALEWERQLDFAQVTAAVEDLLGGREKRLAMSRAGKAHMDTHGLDRVLDIIDALAGP